MNREPIDISNYEIWFIDYLDGALDSTELSTLNSFLDEHPALKEELEGMDETILDAGHVSTRSFDKDVIKQLVLEDAVIQAVEDDVSMSEFQASTGFSAAETQSLYRAYQKIRFQPDTSTIFPDKESLKREEARVIPLWARATAIAASLLVVVLLSIPDGNLPHSAERPGDASVRTMDQATLSEFAEVLSGSLPELTLKESSTEPTHGVSSDKDVIVEPIEEKPADPNQAGKVIQPLLAMDAQSPSDLDLQRVEGSLELKLPDTPVEDGLASIDENLERPPSSEGSGTKTFESPLEYVRHLVEEKVEEQEILAFSGEVDPAAEYVETSVSLGQFELAWKRRKNR